MDKNMKWLKESRVNGTINSLKKNGMNGYLVNSYEELIEKINELTNDGDTVSCGGSMSLFETGVIDYLRSGKYNFLDRYEDGLSKDDLKKLYRNTFSADVYFTSTNAITEKGELYNVDGNGNRVAEPANCKRLNRATPCVKVGHCMDCSSEERICNEYTIIRRQGNKDRIHVIFLNEELGY